MAKAKKEESTAKKAKKVEEPKAEAEEVVEQGFDDDELKDIMEEIDSLEQEFADEEEAAQPEAAASDGDGDDDPLADIEEITSAAGQSGSIEEAVELDQTDAMSDTMDELESVICQDELDAEEEDISAAPVVPMSSSKSMPVAPGGAQDLSADFSVAGNMSLNLNVTVSGQLISLSIDPNQGVTIEMEHGAKFTLPINNKQAA